MEANGVGALLTDGYLRMYDGEQPASSDTDVDDSQVLLAEIGFTSFTASVDGVIYANTMVPEDAALATGNARWFRTFQADGVSPVLDGTIGTADSDVNLNSTSIQKDAEVYLNGFRYLARKA